MKFKTTWSKVVLSLVVAGGMSLPCYAGSKISTNAPVDDKNKAAQLAHYQTRDFRDEVFYFVLPDRFYNGDKSNDLGAAANDTKRALSHGGLDVTHKGMYHGGDLAGLTEKLSYIDNMGVTAIWLTPVLRNRAVQAGTAGYHGYWILDFTEIDPHLGSNDELKRFIDAAHKRNIKVYFDIITNHTADVIKYKECHGDDGLGWIVTGDSCSFKPTKTLSNDSYTPIIPAGEEAVKSPAWLNDINRYHNQGDSHWQGESAIKGDFAGLDDINTAQPQVVDGMIDIYKNIITEFKPDGFRIDTVKHVNMEFWTATSPALMAHAKSQGIDNFMMFGEAYSFEPSFLSKFMTVGRMPSVLDFALQGAIEAVLVNQKGTQTLANLFAQDHYYQTKAGFNASHLVSFTGNHDMGRFAAKLKSSKFNYNESELVKRTLLAHAMMYFTRGVPVIYYGDEQGFVGDGGDQDARQNMMPSFVNTYNDDDLLASDKTTAADNFDIAHPFYQTFAEYADLYQRYPALRKGQQSTLYAQKNPGLFAIKREFIGQNGDKQVMAIVFNSSNKSQNITKVSADLAKLLTNSKLVNHTADHSLNHVSALGFNIYLVNP